MEFNIKSLTIFLVNDEANDNERDVNNYNESRKTALVVNNGNVVLRLSGTLSAYVGNSFASEVCHFEFMPVVVP